MRETWKNNRDTILLVLLCAGLAGLVFEGGRFLVTLLKWPVLIAIAAGLAFGVGNDGFHALKRLVRDRVWPWILRILGR